MVEIYFAFSPTIVDREGLNMRSLKVSRKANGPDKKSPPIKVDISIIANYNIQGTFSEQITIKLGLHQ